MRRIEHATWLNAKTASVMFAVKRVPTSDGCSVARDSEEPSKMRKQMTASAGALIGRPLLEGCRRVSQRPHFSKRDSVAGAPPKGVLLECLSRMTGNCHVRF
jgi:hypothetical protein